MTATLTAVPKNEQQGVIRFLRLQNILGSEIHVKWCLVYGAQIAITKLIVNRCIQRFKMGQMI